MTKTAAVAQAIAPRPAAPAIATTALPAVFALLLGLFIVGVAGFSQIDVIHNAAHNTRHTNAFPCH
jgi:cobalt transporter subunit CbtB